MPITIAGSGTIDGINAGGLPDASIVTADIADANITAAKLSGAQTGAAPIYGCRAWVNFDGTRNAADTGASTNGANVKIRASGNVTSVLKNAVGDYTVTLTTAMPDANYCVVTNIGNDAITPTDTVRTFASRSLTTSNFRLISNRADLTAQDQPIGCASIFR
jgi:hypothetical protein